MFKMGLENLILLGTLLLLVFITGLIVFVVVHQKRAIKLENEKILSEKEQEVKLTEAEIKSQENERKRIGEELHDEIAPLLVSAVLFLNTQLKVGKVQDQTHIQGAVELINTSINKIRNISHILHPVTLENFGFFYALKDFCGLFNKSNSCNIEIHSNLENLPIDKFKQLMLFRILQELILNAVKHSFAKSLILNIANESNSLNISLTHDGGKFDLQDYIDGLQNPNSLGLKNIQHRINLLAGKINFSNKEIGAALSIEIGLS